MPTGRYVKNEKAKTQKFPRGCTVKVDDTMPSFMSHFDAGFTAVVEYSYAQEFGGDDFNRYSLIKLDDTGSHVSSTAWYYAEQLTMVDADTDKGKAIIEKYNYG